MSELADRATSWRANSAGRRVAIGISGGVDSAVAAQLLLDQGYDVLGLTMLVWGQPAEPLKQASVAVCRQLGIDHKVVDLRQAFYKRVVAHFLHEYAAGRTPNPCVRCNLECKFGRLFDISLSLDADYYATGHYCQAILGADGLYQLHKGVDTSKDQSYFLYTLGQEQLARTLFPLGAWLKSEVREFAQSRGMHLPDRRESQDICFIPDGDYRRLLRDHLTIASGQLPQSLRPGPICNTQGMLLGEHKGLAYYTVGQRSGLGVAAPEPLYVLKLDPHDNKLVVGYARELGRTTLVAIDAHFGSGKIPPAGTCVEAKIRYRARSAPASFTPLGSNAFQLEFEQPLRDMAPGQSVVLYRGNQVLGGGIIDDTSV